MNEYPASETAALNVFAQVLVEVLQVGDQLRKRRPLCMVLQPAACHHSVAAGKINNAALQLATQREEEEEEEGEQRNHSQLIGTINRLLQSISVPQERLQLETVHLLVRHPGQSHQFPQQHAEAPAVAGWQCQLFLQRLQGQPLHRPVLVVAQAVVVVGKEVAGQCTVAQLHQLFRWIDHTVPCRNVPMQNAHRVDVGHRLRQLQSVLHQQTSAWRAVVIIPTALQVPATDREIANELSR